LHTHISIVTATATLQAFTTPAAYTLLADAFPESSRATANGIYSSGVYVGGACASLTVLLTASIGWRDCSLWAGSIGIATALLAQAVLREPQRSSDEQTVADAAAVSEAVADGAGLAGVTQSLSTVSWLHLYRYAALDSSLLQDHCVWLCKRSVVLGTRFSY
jgi:predicted MFS family arabinose efflux permease